MQNFIFPSYSLFFSKKTDSCWKKRKFSKIAGVCSALPSVNGTSLSVHSVTHLLSWSLHMYILVFLSCLWAFLLVPSLLVLLDLWFFYLYLASTCFNKLNSRSQNTENYSTDIAITLPLFFLSFLSSLYYLCTHLSFSLLASNRKVSVQVWNSYFLRFTHALFLIFFTQNTHTIVL